MLEMSPEQRQAAEHLMSLIPEENRPATVEDLIYIIHEAMVDTGYFS
jgi:hypothetical protein